MRDAAVFEIHAKGFFCIRDHCFDDVPRITSTTGYCECSSGITSRYSPVATGQQNESILRSTHGPRCNSNMLTCPCSIRVGLVGDAAAKKNNGFLYGAGGMLSWVKIRP